MKDRKEQIKCNRQFMQCNFDQLTEKTDQMNGLPRPPQGKPVQGECILLPTFETEAAQVTYSALLDTRRSERIFADIPITQAQLAFLLWSVQGVQDYRGKNNVATIRPVPSGGARHPFELNIAVRNVEGLQAGIYQYHPMENVGEKRVAIEYIGALEEYEDRITAMLSGQKWASRASLVLFVSCIPYRAEWRYDVAAHRVMLIDLGHLGQNAMLSATALGLGSCCIAAYDQALCDAAFGFDGTDEFTVYAIPIGIPKAEEA